MKITTKPNEQIPVERLTCDGRFQVRAELNAEVVEDYTRQYAAAEGSMPPLVVWKSKADNAIYVVCGHHRFAAATNAGVASLECEVVDGDEREARLRALQDNKKNGLRMTNEDKRRAVEMMLEDKEWAAWSDRKIAHLVGVDHKTVSAHRKRLCGEIPQIDPSDEPETPVETRKCERNGTVYEQKVKPKPERTPDELRDDWWVEGDSEPEEEPDDTVDPLDEAIADARRVREMGERLESGLTEYMRHARAWMKGYDGLDMFGDILNERIKEARAHARRLLDAHVCPHCVGEKCDACQSRGYQYTIPASGYAKDTVLEMCERVAERTGCKHSEVVGWPKS